MYQVHLAKWKRDFDLPSSSVSDVKCSYSPGCLVSIIIKNSDNFSAVEQYLVGHNFCYF